MRVMLLKDPLGRWLILALLSGFAAIAGATETTTYVLTDVQGTVIAREDAQGITTANYDYRPYGWLQSGPQTSGVGYTGHVKDSDTGLVYMQTRYYDPGIGRFLSIDPVRPGAGSVHGINRYEYVYGNPVNRIDPDGRFGRGEGFSGREWYDFNRAQQMAAKRLGGAASQIRNAMKTGKGLGELKKTFEATFGEGSATAANMGKVASEFESMAAALQDDGSHGFVANASGYSTINLKYNVAPTTLAGVPRGSRSLIVNTDHPGFRIPATLQWAAGHESAHAALGVEDQIVDVGGVPQKAYKGGSPEQQQAFRDLPQQSPQGAMINPDTLMDYAQ